MMDYHTLKSRVIYNDFYVDLVGIGAHREELAIQLQKYLISVFKLGCFELRKWSRNSTKLLKAILSEYRKIDSVTIN